MGTLRRFSIAFGLRSLAVAAFVFALGFVTSKASANGRFPQTNLVAVMPGEPSRLLLRSSFGFLISPRADAERHSQPEGGSTRDWAGQWSWVCESAVGFGGQQDPMVLAFENGNLAAAHTGGISVSSDGGCSWTLAPGDAAQRMAVDLAHRPGTANAAVALVSKSIDPSVGEGGVSSPRFETWVMETHDGAGTWKRIGKALDPAFIVHTIEVSPNAPRRLVVSATRLSDSRPKAFLLVSEDDGARWVVRDVPIDGTYERAAYVAAIAKSKPVEASRATERIYLRTDGVERGRVLVTENAGRTFREVWSGSAPKGFSLSEDEGTVFVGSRDGLYAAESGELTFAKRASQEIQCLTTFGATLFACSNEKSGFLLGASNDGGRTFRPQLHFRDIRGPLPCAAGTGVAACEAGWSKVRSELPMAVGLDAGLDSGGSQQSSTSPSLPSPSKGEAPELTGNTSLFASSIRSLAGGVLIGLAAWLPLLLLSDGRIRGISSILAGIVPKHGEGKGFRVAFVLGLVVVGFVAARLLPAAFGAVPGDLGRASERVPSVTLLVVAGMLVGFGTRLAGGCTSIHGVCGVSLPSPRSIVATLVFMAFGVLAVFTMRSLGGAS